MLSLLRNFGAAIAGMICGGIIVGIVESIGHVTYPLPEGMSPSDPEAIAKYVQEAPAAALAFPVAAWICGAFIGPFVATLIAKRRNLVPGAVVMGLLLASVVANLLMFPHPVWMWPGGIGGALAAGCAAIALARVAFKPSAVAPSLRKPT